MKYELLYAISIQTIVHSLLYTIYIHPI